MPVDNVSRLRLPWARLLQVLDTQEGDVVQDKEFLTSRTPVLGWGGGFPQGGAGQATYYMKDMGGEQAHTVAFSGGMPKTVINMLRTYTHMPILNTGLPSKKMNPGSNPHPGDYGFWIVRD